jgi:small-conductance mechanosensitive channel
MVLESLLHATVFEAFDALWNQIQVTAIIVAIATILYYIIKYFLKQRALHLGKRELKSILAITKLGIVIVTSIVLIFVYFETSAILASGIGLIATTVLGFASKNTLSNLIAGILLLFSRPFSIGDRVMINDENERILGDVVDISVIYTKIRTIRNELVTVPNHLLVEKKTVNYSGFNHIIAEVKVSLPYDQDRKTIESLLIEAAIKVEDVVHTPYPYVVLSELGDVGAIYELRAFTNKPNEYIRVQSEIRKAIYDTFKSHGLDLTTAEVQIRREEDKTKNNRKRNVKDSLT